MKNNKHNTIGKGENERAINGGADKFYTKQHIADKYSNKVLELFGTDVDYIEPTAGNGAFLTILPNIQGYDLIPEREDIIEKDVFKNTSFSTNSVIVGNPPFGMNASLAQAIFNHIASFKVKAICFIVPKTFKKTSMQNKLSLDYSIVYEEDVEDNAFLVEGRDKHVPCVFQVWKLTKCKRVKVPTASCKEIVFTTADKANIAVRRAGGRAGQVLQGLNHSKSSTYFIKATEIGIEALHKIDLSVVDNTAGVRSISKHELCTEINKVLGV